MKTNIETTGKTPAIMATERAKIRPFYPIPVTASYPRGVPTKNRPMSPQYRCLSIYQPVESIGKTDFTNMVVLPESTESEILRMLKNRGQPFCLIKEPLDDGTIMYSYVNLQWKVR